MAILCIAQDGHFVVIQVNLVDQHIDQALPVFGVIDVPLAELAQEEANVLHTGNRVLCGLHQQLISGLPPSSIKNILYGKSLNPKIVTIKMICDGLNITLREFFSTSEFDGLEQEIK